MKQDLMYIRKLMQQIIQLTEDIQFKDRRIQYKCESHYMFCGEKCPIACYARIVGWYHHTKDIQDRAKDFLEATNDLIHD